MGNPITVQRLTDLTKKCSPDIIFIFETKNQDEMVMSKLDTLRYEKHFLLSPDSPASGGLALLWKSDVEIQILATTRNFIDTLVSFKGTSFHATFVYGAPGIAKRQAVWNLLSDIASTRSTPWFLTGDFNEIIDNSEKAGGTERPESSFGAFRSFLSSCDLFDIKHTGDFLSWRGQRHSHLVHCRLDRSLANSSWSDLFPNGRTHYLPFEGSDHMPILSTFDSKRKKSSGLFRYDRRFRNNEAVTALVQEVWEASPGLSVANRISKCRKAIVNWSKKFYINSQKKITELKSALDAAMASRTAGTETISLINQDLLKAYKEEEEYWKQRSRQLWLTLGDKNTSFFHASTKSRRARNRITIIETNSGIPVYEEDQIAKVISEYFKEVFTSSNPPATEVVFRALTPCISQATNDKLTLLPSTEEIKEAMFAIQPDKAPGPDGFSASFFLVELECGGTCNNKRNSIFLHYMRSTLFNQLNAH